MQDIAHASQMESIQTFSIAAFAGGLVNGKTIRSSKALGFRRASWRITGLLYVLIAVCILLSGIATISLWIISVVGAPSFCCFPGRPRFRRMPVVICQVVSRWWIRLLLSYIGYCWNVFRLELQHHISKQRRTIVYLPFKLGFLLAVARVEFSYWTGGLDWQIPMVGFRRLICFDWLRSLYIFSQPVAHEELMSVSGGVFWFASTSFNKIDVPYRRLWKKFLDCANKHDTSMSMS